MKRLFWSLICIAALMCVATFCTSCDSRETAVVSSSCCTFAASLQTGELGPSGIIVVDSDDYMFDCKVSSSVIRQLVELRNGQDFTLVFQRVHSTWTLIGWEEGSE